VDAQPDSLDSPGLSRRKRDLSGSGFEMVAKVAVELGEEAGQVNVQAARQGKVHALDAVVRLQFCGKNVVEVADVRRRAQLPADVAPEYPGPAHSSVVLFRVVRPMQRLGEGARAANNLLLRP